MTKGTLRKLYFINPILLGQFFVLFIYTHNIGQVNFGLALRSFALVMTLTVVMSLFVVFFVRDWPRGALAVSLIVTLFFTYGRVNESLMLWQLSNTHWSYRHIQYISILLIGIWGGLLVGGLVILYKYVKSVVTITKIVNIFIITLIFLSLGTVARFNFEESLGKKVINGKVLSSTQINQETLPDIYYLVFDRYARGDVLEQHFQYSNDEFLSWLETRGFYVATESNANYPRTSQSLAASLDMEYLTGVKDTEEGEQHDWSPLYDILENNIVTKSLKGSGYRYIHFGDWWHPTSTNSNADININYWRFNEFELALLKTTPFYQPRSHVGDSFRREHYDRIKYKFDKLRQMAALEGPKFIFAHMLIPHTPYVFNEDGTFLPREELNTNVNKLYLNQVKAANTEIKKVIEAIQSTATEKRPIVIILQADEGPYPKGFDAVQSSNWKNATDDELRIKFGILNAFYMSGENYDTLYQSISPVNIFRIIFNKYFDADLEILEDKSFAFEDLDHIYSFFDVTGRVRSQR